MDQNLILLTAVLLIAVGLTFLYLLLGRRPGWMPRDAMEWIGSALSVALIVSAVALIVTAFRVESATSPAMMVAPGGSPPEIVDMALDADAGNFAYRLVEDGTEEDLAGLEGKVVLVNFWATWCAPCLSEIPELNRLAKEYGDRGLVVLSVSDEDPALLSDFDARFGLDTRSVHVQPGAPLPAPFTQAFDVRPTSFVIDRTGRVKRYMLGARSFDIFERFVLPHLEG
jgi:thiol-disulfide isomerase/thioredoxin